MKPASKLPAMKAAPTAKKVPAKAAAAKPNNLGKFLHPKKPAAKPKAAKR